MAIEKTVNGVKLTVAYTEERTKGGGPRSIEVVVRPTAKDHKITGTGKMEYKITPNPHDNAKYNDKGQPAFYLKCAEAIASHLAVAVTQAAAAATAAPKAKFGKPAPKAKAAPSTNEVKITWGNNISTTIYAVAYKLAH